ncbi:MAG: UDP-N-acetylglucosamine 2-epimerase [Oscillospiraceae bacterium]
MQSIAVVTGTRAEYGLLRPVLAKLYAGGRLDVQLLVTGAHLAAEYGHTVDEIVADGHPIAERLDILSAEAAPGRLGTAQRTHLALGLFLRRFAKNTPDAVLLLGDRYEAFAAGQAAALLDIPVVHISGGDVTRGADDDWFRHCLSKMAKLHFPSCAFYRRRLLRMGEEPGRVFNVGGLGDENIRNTALLGHAQLEAALGFALPQPYALVTFHPETAGALSPERQAGIFLEALAQQNGLFYLFTAANADAGGDVINAKARAFCTARGNAQFVLSLGTQRYLSAMRGAALVVGNSSSGVMETPTLHTPAVDVGERQTGRLRPANVLHCPLEVAAIAQAVETARGPAFAAQAAAAQSPYDGGDTSGRIVALVEEFLAGGKLRGPKVFYDAEGDNA